MGNFDFLQIFQGVATLVDSEPKIIIGRVVLIAIGLLLIYLGKKGILEALIMIPMGVGMSVINAAVMFVTPKMALDTDVDAATGLAKGTLFLNPLISEGDKWIDLYQFIILPQEDGTTRLILRTRTMMVGGVWTIIHPGAFIMERGLLLGIKERAENLARSN